MTLWTDAENTGFFFAKKKYCITSFWPESLYIILFIFYLFIYFFFAQKDSVFSPNSIVHILCVARALIKAVLEQNIILFYIIFSSSSGILFFFLLSFESIIILVLLSLEYGLRPRFSISKHFRIHGGGGWVAQA